MNKFNFNPSMKNAKWLIMLMMVLISPGAFAQGGNADNSTLLIAVIVVGVLALMVLLVSIYTLQVLNVVLRSEEAKRAKETGVEHPCPHRGYGKKFLRLLIKGLMQKMKSPLFWIMITMASRSWITTYHHGGAICFMQQLFLEYSM